MMRCGWQKRRGAGATFLGIPMDIWHLEPSRSALGPARYATKAADPPYNMATGAPRSNISGGRLSLTWPINLLI